VVGEAAISTGTVVGAGAIRIGKVVEGCVPINTGTVVGKTTKEVGMPAATGTAMVGAEVGTSRILFEVAES
jgi:hypothetical protein